MEPTMLHANLLVFLLKRYKNASTLDEKKKINNEIKAHITILQKFYPRQIQATLSAPTRAHILHVTFADLKWPISSPFRVAIAAKNHEIIKLFLSLGMKLDVRPRLASLTPLQIAIAANDADLVILLLLYGADPNLAFYSASADGTTSKLLTHIKDKPIKDIMSAAKLAYRAKDDKKSLLDIKKIATKCFEFSPTFTLSFLNKLIEYMVNTKRSMKSAKLLSHFITPYTRWTGREIRVFFNAIYTENENALLIYNLSQEESAKSNDTASASSSKSDKPKDEASLSITTNKPLQYQKSLRTIISQVNAIPATKTSECSFFLKGETKLLFFKKHLSADDSLFSTIAALPKIGTDTDIGGPPSFG